MRIYDIGFTAGAFDLFHVGHLNIIRKSKNLCKYLIVGVLSDEYILKTKGRKPVISCENRMEIIKSIRYVDEVVKIDFHNTLKCDAWKLYHFNVCFSGDDHAWEDLWKKDKENLKKLGVELIYFPYTKSVSSTIIKKKLEI